MDEVVNRPEPMGSAKIPIAKGGGKSPADQRPPAHSLDIQDYLDATGDAATRSRTFTLAMVVACALVFVGVVNSLQHSWMLERIQASNDSASSYVASKIARPPSADLSARPIGRPDSTYEDRYQTFYSALWKSYIDTAYYVHVPFFGFAIDANDLGIFAGLAFTIIAVLMRFSLAREIENLRASFHRVREPLARYEFYILLSMRQVLTVPKTEFVHRSTFAWLAPKAVWFFPVILQSLVAVHDYRTNSVGLAIDDVHTRLVLWANGLLVAVVFVCMLSVTRRMFVMDRIWDQCWKDLNDARVVEPVSPPTVTFWQSPARWLVLRRRGHARRVHAS